ncbi:DUF6461 domain-containing protein [Streptosporangium canum]|uniref:DUF6461 domain-containing protein n=1 Tax=Streptosporangium canum TaxID=324952 RepID=UPI003680DEC7
MEDGEIRLGFEPPFAADRYGSDPDGAIEAMRWAGLDLECDGSRADPGSRTADDVQRAWRIRHVAGTGDDAAGPPHQHPSDGHESREIRQGRAAG